MIGKVLVHFCKSRYDMMDVSPVRHCSLRYLRFKIFKTDAVCSSSKQLRAGSNVGGVSGTKVT